MLVGWDGAERAVVYGMLKKGALPNLQKIINEGSIADIAITTGKTETKPGWTEILTGYNALALGIFSNEKYEPIPVGYTIFERVEERYGQENIVTIFITGKINNTGARGPHRVCANCYKRDPVTFEKTGWWDETSDTLINGVGEKRIFEERKGEPFYHTKNALDMYRSALGKAPNVGALAIELIQTYKDRRFFMFIHFEEPDEAGHVYGGWSKEYKQGIIDDDKYLGEIVSELKRQNLYGDTVIYIVTDHGFNQNGRDHYKQPEIFLATNDTKKMRSSGTRLDIAPTILDRLGFDIQTIVPSLNGESIYK